MLPYTVRGCAAWDSREGWLILFEQFSQLQQFASEWGGGLPVLSAWWACPRHAVCAGSRPCVSALYPCP